MDVGYLICAAVWRRRGAARFVRGKAHLHPVSVWRERSFIPPSFLAHGGVPPLSPLRLPRRPVRRDPARGAIHGTSRLRRVHNPRALAYLRPALPLRPLVALPTLHPPPSLATSNHRAFAIV